MTFDGMSTPVRKSAFDDGVPDTLERLLMRTPTQSSLRALLDTPIVQSPYRPALSEWCPPLNFGSELPVVPEEDILASVPLPAVRQADEDDFLASLGQNEENDCLTDFLNDPSFMAQLGQDAAFEPAQTEARSFPPALDARDREPALTVFPVCRSLPLRRRRRP